MHLNSIIYILCNFRADNNHDSGDDETINKKDYRDFKEKNNFEIYKNSL